MTPPSQLGAGCASLVAIGALTALTVAFTAYNVRLGSRKVFFGPDTEYHGEVGERDMDKCTNWLI
ncbi:unnamed protein product [Prorocentrum cordatum]|uniref:Uncharacterized protein n=1 Tax=Prorocentrum cordatum TaxID=2364126 RepID=A0ABN9SVD6_9DINO|nr:unnamed protein product [Polarella glacialis]